MKLAELLRGVTPLSVEGSIEGEIAEVRDDSRLVEPGDLFVALRGQNVDATGFAAEAAARGAVAMVSEHEIARDVFDGTRVRVDSAAQALGNIASRRYGQPSRSLRMIAVTGTNGKTTTTFLLEAMLQAAGRPTGVIGTVNYRYGNVVKDAALTTPTALLLHHTLAQMQAAGMTHVVMEASSHALALDRLEGIHFRVAAFTNLTQDHLDFHGGMEPYFQAKAQLFSHLLRPDNGVGVIMVDGNYGRRMATTVVGERILVSLRDEGADIFPLTRSFSLDGIKAELSSPLGSLRVNSRLLGEYNLANIIVAVGIAVALGLDSRSIEQGIERVAGVPGRVERVPPPGARAAAFSVIVDYAHTPDALENVIATLRPLTTGRLLCVFGCGGDRDRGKRPLMGRVVARDADLALVTSDNPRTEEPQAIVDMILEGVRAAGIAGVAAADLANGKRGYCVEIDRRRAIEQAIGAARPGDVVLIAGKGHEDYQILGKTKHPFDDRVIAREAMTRLEAQG